MPKKSSRTRGAVKSKASGNRKTTARSSEKLSLENKSLRNQLAELKVEAQRTRQEVEAALESAQRQKLFFESLVRNNPAAIVSIDRQSNITGWNPAAEELFGYGEAEVLGLNIDDLVAKNKEMHDEAVGFSGQATKKKSFHAFTKRTRKDGSLVEVEVLGLPMRVEDARVGTIVIYHDITELQRARQQAEEARDAAQREKEYSQALVQNNPAAIVSIDPQAVVTAWNPAAEKLFGYMAEEAIGRNIDELVANDKKIRAEAVGFSNQATHNESFHAFTKRTRKGGSLVEVEVLGLPMLMADERVGTIVIYHDITDLQRARQEAESARDAAQREKEYSQALVQNSPVAIVTMDPQSNVMGWNPAAEKLFGYTEVEAMGRNVDELVASIEQIHAQAVDISQQSSSGEMFRIITQRTRKDKSLVDVELLALPMFVNGKVIGTIGIYHDIAELQRAREEAEQARDAANREKEFFEVLVKNNPVAVVTIDNQARVTSWNPAAEKLFKYSQAEALGRDVDDLVANRLDLHQEAVGYSNIGLETDTDAFQTIAKRTRKDGNLVDVEVSGVPIVVQGTKLGMYALYHDLTELQRARHEAEQARSAAEQANKANSAFLATMSHELRTPLNAIIGFTRIVRKKGEGALPDKQLENLDKVLSSAEHLLGLINTVLDIAKIEAGRMDVHAANFNVRALTDMCVTLATPLLKPNVRLEADVPESVGSIFSDQDKIKQIILNLLSNAAKFTHQGRIGLRVEPGEVRIRIHVTDSGIGISEEALGRVFEEFQQADTSTTRQYGGTGLGLAISRNLARLLGGDLTATSELGKGSTFTLMLPIHYEGAPTVPRETPQADVRVDPQPETVPNSSKKLILVIDDDPDAVYLLQENLGQHEFQVVGARNGMLGHEKARELKPHAILLDVVMPGKDGWQVLHDLKADPLTANIPVILLTIIDKKALGFKLGAAAYLLKPLDPAAVIDALKRVAAQPGRAKKHVLVVDDDPHIADMLNQILPASDFVLLSAADGIAGLEAIEKSRPDVVLLDLMMPRLDGFGVIERLRMETETRDLPIIVISAKELTDAESKKLKESVTFVMKKQGFDGESLVREINTALAK